MSLLMVRYDLDIDSKRHLPIGRLVADDRRVCGLDLRV
jgi:hypothetical protein